MSDRRKNDPYNPEVRYYPETMDVVVWQRFRDNALREFINPKWVDELSRLHHVGRINTGELLASQRYQKEYKRWRNAQAYDVEEMRGDQWAREEIEENHKIMKETQGLLTHGRCLHQFEDLVIRHMVLTPKGLMAARRAMVLLQDFFGIGTKRERK
jgi:hypothetical protein